MAWSKINWTNGPRPKTFEAYMNNIEEGINEAMNMFGTGGPVKEAEITESGKGNGIKEPSATKLTFVALYFQAKEDKLATLKVEVGTVIVFEFAQSAVAALKSTETANFVVPAGEKFTVTYSECEKLIPVFQTF